MKIQQEETISAISTPLGEGGIGMIRLSGGSAVEILKNIFRGPTGKERKRFQSHRVNYGFIVDDKGRKIDEVLATVMLSPLTYTREDVVEISCHGSIATLKMILRRTIEAGARMAEPGEFSKRAFLNGRIDLVQAEAIIDLIRTKSAMGWSTAFSQLDGKLSLSMKELENKFIELIANIEMSIDFPEEEQEIIGNETIISKLQDMKGIMVNITNTYVVGRIYREGIAVSIAGRPNVGKSSLMNALLQRERAIVSPLPGTTRDTIEETLHVEGVAIRIVDTAGLRESTDIAESEGIRRAMKAVNESDIALIVFDGSRAITKEDTEIATKVRDECSHLKSIIPVINKTDIEVIIDTNSITEMFNAEPVLISAKQGKGLDILKARINKVIDRIGTRYDDGPVLTRERHYQKFMLMEASITNAISAISANRSREFAVSDLQEAKEALDELTGKVVDASVIEKIFSEFCIGK